MLLPLGLLLHHYYSDFEIHALPCTHTHTYINDTCRCTTAHEQFTVILPCFLDLKSSQTHTDTHHKRRTSYTYTKISRKIAQQPKTLCSSIFPSILSFGKSFDSPRFFTFSSPSLTKINSIEIDERIRERDGYLLSIISGREKYVHK